MRACITSRALEVAEEVQIKHRIDGVYTRSPFSGARKIAAQVQREGMGINRKTVGRSMSERGLAAIYPGPNLSQGNHKEGVDPYLTRVTSPARTRSICGALLLPTLACEGAGCPWWRSWTGTRARWEARELEQTLELPFVLSTVQRALGQTVPLICNSAQGSHFTSPQSCQLLQAAHVQISRDGKGRALDHIFTERLWRTVKYEEVYLHDSTSPRQARQALTRYFAFYTQERPHQALDYQTPADVYFHTGAPRQRPSD